MLTWMRTLLTLALLLPISASAAEYQDVEAELIAAKKELEQAKVREVKHTDGRTWSVVSITELDGKMFFKDKDGKMQNFPSNEITVTPPKQEVVSAIENKIAELEKLKKQRVSKPKPVDLDAVNLDKLPYAERQAKLNELQGMKAKPEFVAYMSKLDFDTIEEAGLFVMNAVPAPRGMDLQIQMRQDHKLNIEFRRINSREINLLKPDDRTWFWTAAVTRFAIRGSEQDDLMMYVPPENATTGETSVQTAKRRVMRDLILKMKAKEKEKETPAAPKP